MAALAMCAAGISTAQEMPVSRGEILFSAAGCLNCHTDTKNKGQPLAGGRALATPFGAFYGPNITPHRKYGIGNWSDRDFVRALRDGIAPDGSHYFPVFPYTSFANMTDTDLLEIKKYLFAQPPVARPNTPHDVSFPFNLRFAQIFWKALYFSPGPWKPVAERSAEWNRGAYLVNAVAHCGECHTPRNFLGGLGRNQWMAGAAKGRGPEGESTPNITPHQNAGIGKWSLEEIVEFLGSGEYPDGDFAGSLMAEVIENGTDKLSETDREAIAVYLKSLEPLP